MIYSNKVKFLPTVLPQAAKLPGTSGLLKKTIFWEKVLPQAAKLPGTSGFFKKVNFLPKVLPQAAKLPGTSGIFKKNRFLEKSAPGSEAAPDKWLHQRGVDFWKKLSRFSGKDVLPQAAKLPGTSGLFKRKSGFCKSSAPGSEAARDKLLLQKKHFCQKFCPRQRSCPRQVASSKKSIFCQRF